MNGIAKMIPVTVSGEEWLRRIDALSRDELESQATQLRDSAHGDLITYAT